MPRRYDYDEPCANYVPSFLCAAAVLIVMLAVARQLHLFAPGSGPGSVSACSGVSAKLAVASSDDHDDQPPAEGTGYHGVGDEWLYTESDKPDDPAPHPSLANDFTWEASAEDEQKFDQHKVDTAKVKGSANTKALNATAVGREPSNYRKLGLVHPLLNLYHGHSKAQVKFSRGSCAWFGGTDAYYGARKAQGGLCDCGKEECDRCVPE